MVRPEPTLVRLCLGAVLPAVCPAQWGPVPTAIAPQEQAAAPACYDLLNDRTWLLSNTLAGAETWGFDGTNWSLAASAANGPPGLRGAALVYDFQQAVALCYGGQSATSTPAINDDRTWIWNGTTWTQLLPPASPGGLARCAIAHDLVRGRTVIYGGSRNDWTQVVSSDTYEFDGTRWTQSFAFGPGPRQRAAMAFQPTLGKVMLFGGSGPFGADDATWLYDGLQWQLAPVVGPRPAARIDAALVTDLGRGVCLLVGGQDPVTLAVHDDTWEFDGTSWRLVGRQVSPPRTQASVVFDMARRRPLLFGGRGANLAVYGDTWNYAAYQQTFGLGCMGSFGRPTLVPGAPPALGAVGSVTLTGLDPNATTAGMTIGWSRTQWAFGTLPASLTFLGMTGCVAYASADQVGYIAAAGGSATWSFAVPALPQIFGLQVHLQGFSFDPLRNPLGVVTSNLDTLTLGW